jgi:DAACS family dicarboxylate/amino acid:cation (Na+ or H+) symporter
LRTDLSSVHSVKSVIGLKWLARPPLQMLFCMALGLAVGEMWPSFGTSIEPLGTVFIQGIRMIVIPLIFATVTLGAFNMGRQIEQLGRIALVAFGLFFAATLIATAIGLMLNHLLHPGLGTGFAIGGNIAHEIKIAVDWKKFLLESMPSNVIADMAAQKVLPTLIFSLLFGLALGRLGTQARRMTELVDILAQAMFLITKWIVAIAPIAVFAIMAWLAATQGKATLYALTKLIGAMYLGLGVITVMFAATLRLVGEKPLLVARRMGAPLLLAFTMRSMEVAFPLQLQKLEELGVPKRIAAVVLPLGYSFNLTGSAMYIALACTFLSDAYGVHLDGRSLATILLTTFIASKGIANVPAGALVALATVLAAVGLPANAIALITGIDIFLDMGRTAINFIGNTVAVLLVQKTVRVRGFETQSGYTTHGH